MKKCKFVLLFICVLTISSSFAREFISYTNVELSYATIKQGQANYNGQEVSGSFELGDHFYLGAGLAKSNVGSADQETVNLAAGFHANMSTNADIYVEIFQANFEEEYTYGSTTYKTDATGLGATVGFHHTLSEKIQLNTGVGFFRFEDADEVDASGFIGAHYYFSDQVSLGATLAKADEVTSLGLSLRVFFN